MSGSIARIEIPHAVVPLGLLVLLLASTTCCLPGCSRSAPVRGPVKTGTVTIEVKFADETHQAVMENVASGTTLESVLREVSQPEFSIKGTGVTAFVDRIGDQSTDATQGWTYRIDGAFSNQGVGTATLDPPTTITWEFGSMESDE